MRVTSPAPLGSPGDNPDPKARTRFPTDRPWPEVDHDRNPLRKSLYLAVKKEPITGEQAARLTRLPLTEAIDELRILENWLLVRHTADEKGVLRWRWNPANHWERGIPF